MGIGIYEGNDQIEAADNHISNVFGDCIFNYTWDSPQSNNLNYHHNICELTGRQGITINEGNNIKVEWNIIRDVAMSAIATEDQRNKTATFENVYIRNNLISNWNWYHGQYEILSSTVGNPTIVTTKTDHYLPNGWLSFWGHSGVANDGWVYQNATVLDSRRVSVPTYSNGGGATGTIEHYWESAAIYGSNGAEDIINYKNIHVENNKFMGGDVELKRNINSRPEIFYAGSVAKEGLYIRNNTFDLPTDQRTGPAVRAANVVSGEISGNNFQGQTINCSNCNIIQNNNN